MKHFKLIIVCWVIIGALSSSAVIAEAMSKTEELTRQLMNLKNEQSSVIFESNGRQYRYFTDLLAIPFHQNGEKPPKSSFITLGNVNVISIQSASVSAVASGYRLVQDTKTNALGYMTGTIKLQFKREQPAEPLASELGLVVLTRRKPRHIAYLKPSRQQNINELLNTIKQLNEREEVVRADLVILRRLSKPG